jgi:hypothetical protein
MNEKRIKPAHNRTYPQVAVSYSADTFVVYQSVVLRINISAVNRHLRVAANRCRQVCENST